MPTRPPCRGPEPMCANFCPHGYRYQDDGCMTCDCVVPEVRRRPSATRAGRPRCRGPMPMCANSCPHGYRYKPDGCMTCDCVDEPLPQNCEVLLTCVCCCRFLYFFADDFSSFLCLLLETQMCYYGKFYDVIFRCSEVPQF